MPQELKEIGLTLHQTEATIARDGSLILTNPPFPPLIPGEKIWVILSIPTTPQKNEANRSLEGSVLSYEDPFEPADIKSEKGSRL